MCMCFELLRTPLRTTVRTLLRTPLFENYPENTFPSLHSKRPANGGTVREAHGGVKLNGAKDV